MDELVEERPVPGALVRHRGARLERHGVDRSAPRIEVQHGALWIRATDAGPGVLASHGATTVQVRDGAAVLEVSDFEALLVVVAGRAAVKGAAALPRSVTAGQAVTLTLDGGFGHPEALSADELAADRFVAENLARDALASVAPAPPAEGSSPAGPAPVPATTTAPEPAPAPDVPEPTDTGPTDTGPTDTEPRTPPNPAFDPVGAHDDPWSPGPVTEGPAAGPPPDAPGPEPAKGSPPPPTGGRLPILGDAARFDAPPSAAAGPSAPAAPSPAAAPPAPAGPPPAEEAPAPRSYFDPIPIPVPDPRAGADEDLAIPEPGRRGLVVVVIVLVVLAAVVGAIVLSGDEPRSAPASDDPAPLATGSEATAPPGDAAPAEATLRSCQGGASGYVAEGVVSGGGPDADRYDVVVGVQDVAGEVYAEKTATVAVGLDPGVPVAWTADLALAADQVRPDSECLVVEVAARP